MLDGVSHLIEIVGWEAFVEGAAIATFGVFAVVGLGTLAFQPLSGCDNRQVEQDELQARKKSKNPAPTTEAPDFASSVPQLVDRMMAIQGIFKLFLNQAKLRDFEKDYPEHNEAICRACRSFMPILTDLKIRELFEDALNRMDDTGGLSMIRLICNLQYPGVDREGRWEKRSLLQDLAKHIDALEEIYRKSDIWPSKPIAAYRPKAILHQHQLGAAPMPQRTEPSPLRDSLIIPRQLRDS